MNNREIRPPKDDDQENITKAFYLIKELMNLNSQIEDTLWASAIWSVLIDGYRNCNVSYEEFCNEWENIKEHYKKWWEK